MVTPTLNCDLGEAYGSWVMGPDEALMPHIDLANIACGFHAGDPSVMRKTLQLAANHSLKIGAHPSYPDRQGFGRRSMQMSREELTDQLHYQLAALTGMAALQGLSLFHVKPHGALYNDMHANKALRETVLGAVASFNPDLKIMMLAGPYQQQWQREAEQFGLSLLFEAFADRRYEATGELRSRQQPNAVLNHGDMLAQVKQMVSHQHVTAQNGSTLAMSPDTICVHGDTPAALAAVAEIRQLLATSGD